MWAEVSIGCTTPAVAVMSAESSRSNPPLRASLPINFVIIGGGIAGLACALALQRAGHHALVLERTDKTGARGHGGVRLPPNLTKILFHWGLRDALMSKASITKRLIFMRYESGDYLGSHVWDAEMLRESRGMFLMLSHAELYDMLYEAAVRDGAKVRYGADVAEIDVLESKIMLVSGEEVSGDVLVGADGEFGLSRADVAGERAPGVLTGMALYDVVIPTESIAVYAAKVRECDGQFIAFGSGRAIVAYPTHGTEEVALQLYAPDGGQEGRFGDEPSVSLPSVAGGINEKLQAAVHSARKAVRVTIRDYPDLEDWVSDDGRLVLIGEAAHPFPPSSVQGTAMAVEDGAVLAKLFSHLSEERQIESFLYAYQELRQARVRTVRAGDSSGVCYMTAEGAEAAQRDALMREKATRGVNVLEGGDIEAVWEEYRVVFGYDCEDEADDWWVQWGMLRERALHARGAGERVPSLLDLASAMTSTVVTSADD